MADRYPLPIQSEELPGFEVLVTGERVRAYADAAGDHNPIHLDAAFAAGTPFGGPIAHGMLLLAYLSRLLSARFGPAWVEGGSLDARFRAPALVGAVVRVGGQVTAVEQANGSATATCALRIHDAQGQALVTATATVPLRPGA
jgi:acyl dehydratase